MSLPHGVVCYWQFTASKTKFREDCKWELVESFTIDCDGHCIETPSTGGGERQEYHKWTNERVYFIKDEEKSTPGHNEGEWYTEAELKAIGKTKDDAAWDDFKPIMGRAVTLWTVGGGVDLLDIHPPEWASWLSSSFYEELRKLPKWSIMLEKGYDLHFGTINEAHKYITFNKTKKPQEGESRGKRNRR